MTLKKLTTVLLFLAFLISQIPILNPPVKASPSTWYVSPTGDDNGPGSDPLHPFQTIQRAINASDTSDIINLLNGTYLPSSRIRINRSGTPSEWYTIRNYNGEHIIINGSNCPYFGSGGDNYSATIEILKGMKYIRITGITINYGQHFAITCRSNCSHIRIDNCSITNITGSAFKTVSEPKLGGGCSYISFEHNSLSNDFNNWSGQGTGQETISLSNTSHFTIHGNIIRNCHVENIDIKAGCNWGTINNNTINTTASYVLKAGKVYYGGMAIYLDTRGISHNITICNNLLYGNNSGIFLQSETAVGHYENISIFNNIINITNTTGGEMGISGRYTIILADDGGSTQVFKDLKIYCNTLNSGINNTCPTIYVKKSLSRTRISRLNISNNIITAHNKTTSVFSYYIMSFPELRKSDECVTLNNNLYFNSFPGSTLRIRWIEGDFTKSSPAEWGNYPLFVPPEYEHILPFNPHLNTTSPCIDTATSSLVATTDYDGLFRPQFGLYDRGALEYPDFIPPAITIQVPNTGDALQDDITLQSMVTDPSGVAWVFYAIRDPGGEQGTMIDSMYETLIPSSTSGNTWQFIFDTTQLPDGYYILFVNASDIFGNIGYTTVNFSIHNWAILQMLPNTPNSKAGRTIPIKFSLHIAAAVDPIQPFIRNEELTIIIYEKNHPDTILQVSTYGDHSTDYRINSTEKQYITNFKTLKTPKTYVVEIWRIPLRIASFEFQTEK